MKTFVSDNLIHRYTIKQLLEFSQQLNCTRDLKVWYNPSL